MGSTYGALATLLRLSAMADSPQSMSFVESLQEVVFAFQILTCKLADLMALLVARCVSPYARLGHTNDEALTGRFHDFLGKRVQPVECEETPDLGKEALQ